MTFETVQVVSLVTVQVVSLVTVQVVSLVSYLTACRTKNVLNT